MVPCNEEKLTPNYNLGQTICGLFQVLISLICPKDFVQDYIRRHIFF